MAERYKDRPVEWDEKEIRQMVECVKVVFGKKLPMIFRGGMEREVRLAENRGLRKSRGCGRLS